MSEQAENLSLRKITKETFGSILALKVAEGQEDLVRQQRWPGRRSMNYFRALSL